MYLSLYHFCSFFFFFSLLLLLYRVRIKSGAHALRMSSSRTVYERLASVVAVQGALSC